MAEQHSYDVTIDGSTYTVDSDKPLSDVEAYNYAKTQHTAAPAAAAPFDVKAQNAKMQANMAKQTGASESPTDAFLRGASGDTEGMTNPVAKAGGFFMRNGPSRLVRGAAGILNTPGGGGDTMQPGERTKTFPETEHDLNDVIGGGGLTMAPFIPATIAAAPLTATSSLLAGTATGATGAVAAKVAGADPDTTEMVGNLSGLAGGIAGAKAPGVVGDALIRGGSFVEKTPSTRQMLGSLARKTGEAMTATPKVEVPGLDRTMPNVSSGKSVKLYGPSAEGIGVDPPTNADPHMPNVSAGPARYAPDAEVTPGSPVDHYMPNKSGGEQHKFDPAASASDVTPAPVIEHDINVPSQTPAMSEADRAALIETMRNRRAASNAGFESATKEFDPLSPGASPQDIASSYAKSKGLPEPVPHEPVKVDPKFSKAVADAYETMVDNPSDPSTKQAYDALIRETKDQFGYVKAHTGLVTEPWTKSGQPYANSKAMIADVTDNNHMWYFPTEKGFGTGTAGAHPLLAVDEETGMPINDMLRIVHDYFAHAKGGHQFGPNGEENAFLEHAKLYSPDAMAALASETRGQNSWVNFGPHSELPPAQRPFAPQKAGLLPPAMRGLNPENVSAGAVPLADATKVDSTMLADAGTHVRSATKTEPVSTETNVQEAVARLKNAKIKIPADKMKISNMEVVDPSTGTTTNGSGERGQVSAEDLARVTEMKARGEKVVVRKGGKGGTERELIDPKAIADYQPQPGEVVGRLFPDGRFREIARGERVGSSPKMTPIAEQLKAALAARQPQ